jgi:hypothetical protein
LDNVCKGYKRNKGNRKRKRRKEIKICIWTPGNPFGPTGETAHGLLT